jgi:tetratricopeptide (TPR) repeat protein
MDDLKKIEKEIPNNPLLDYDLAKAYWDKGDFETAKIYFNKSKQNGIEDVIKNPQSEKTDEIGKEYYSRQAFIDQEIKDKKVYKSLMKEDLGENAEMSQPQSLREFVKWGIENYPSKHYVLVIMGHGAGWKGSSEMSPRQISEAISGGLQDANEKTGRKDKFDTLVMNSCYMGSSQAVLQMKNVADFTLVSQNYVNGNAFKKWDTIIKDVQKDINDGKLFEGKKFASGMVDFFKKINKEVNENYPDFADFNETYLTMTAIENEKMGALADSFNSFLQTVKGGNANKQLFEAIDKARGYMPHEDVVGGSLEFFGQLKDMGSIIDNVRNSSETPDAVKKAAEELRKAFDEVIVNEQHEGQNMEGSQGLTLWGPTNYVDYSFYSSGYFNMVPDFVKRSGWKVYLDELVTKMPRKILADVTCITNEIQKIEMRLSSPNLDEKKKAELETSLKKYMDQYEQVKKDSYFGNVK